MNSVKTYNKINKNDEKLNFSISKMEDIYDSRQGATDEPHRHDYYTVLIVKKANGIHKIDFESYELMDSQVYFVSPGQVHQVIEKKVLWLCNDFFYRLFDTELYTISFYFRPKPI